MRRGGSAQLLERQPAAEPDPLSLTLSESLQKRIPLHSMGPIATARLAKANIYTTAIPEHPGQLLEHLSNQGYERALGRIAARATLMLSSITAYQKPIAEGALAESLA